MKSDVQDDGYFTMFFIFKMNDKKYRSTIKNFEISVDNIPIGW